MAADLAGETPPEGDPSSGQRRARVVAGGRELLRVKAQGVRQCPNIVIWHKRDLAGFDIAQPWAVTPDGGGHLGLREAVQAASVEDQPAQRPTVNVVECALLQLAPRHLRPINACKAGCNRSTACGTPSTIWEQMSAACCSEPDQAARTP